MNNISKIILSIIALGLIEINVQLYNPLQIYSMKVINEYNYCR